MKQFLKSLLICERLEDYYSMLLHTSEKDLEKQSDKLNL